VFVANPSKSPAITDILLKNKQKLIDFLTKFQESRSDDEQFAEEKSYLIRQIKELK
jgi:calcium binding protein 39